MTELKGLRVLIVEDEVLIADLVQEMLVDLGCVPIGPATTLDKAHALLANETIDAALLDVRLGRQEVFSLAQALLGRGVPFAFMSGSGVHGMPQPWQGHPSLGKPFTPDQLAACLRGLR
jgi:DNA-binding response OmpR family regulator